MGSQHPQTPRLSQSQHQLYAYLLARRGRVIPRQDLAIACGLPVVYANHQISWALDVRISDLRKKIGGSAVLRSVRSRGYLLEASQ